MTHSAARRKCVGSFSVRACSTAHASYAHVSPQAAQGIGPLQQADKRDNLTAIKPGFVLVQMIMTRCIF